MQLRLCRQCQCITKCFVFLHLTCNLNAIIYYRNNLFLVDFPSRISGDVPYIYILLIIFATDIVQFDNILVNTMCLKFLIVGRPTLLYIFLGNLVHSICLLVNPAFFLLLFLNIDCFVVYLVLKTYCSFYFS